MIQKYVALREWCDETFNFSIMYMLASGLQILYTNVFNKKNYNIKTEIWRFVFTRFTTTYNMINHSFHVL